MPITSLKQIAPLLNAEHTGADAHFQFVSTDTRTLQPGELFVALTGPHFQGEQFLAAAIERGAVAAIVPKDVSLPTVNLPLLKVADTRIALGQLAKQRREKIKIPVVGITGSCGKTTTKTMLASILSRKGNVLATQGTLNNDIGVPLTLLQLTEEHQFGVIELGANHLHEIQYIAEITNPDIAIITNAAPVHLEGFGDLAGVARGKGEILQALSPNGIGVLNADDPFINFWRDLLGERFCFTFGFNENADVRARDIKRHDDGTMSFVLQTQAGEIPVQLSVLGQHNIYNALAAATAAERLGISLADIAAGLADMKPVAKRLIRQLGFNNAVIIDDTYNANPTSFLAAIQLLVQETSDEKILIVGDMAELGDAAEQFHAEVGLQARKLGVDHLYAVGEWSRFAANAFGEGAQHFADKTQLAEKVRPTLHPQMTVLIKGSRGARMETVVADLRG